REGLGSELEIRGERPKQDRYFRRAHAAILRRAQEQRADESTTRVRPLDVSADPEEIVRDAARKVRSAPHDVDGHARRVEERDGARLAAREHPGVLAATAALHRDDQRVPRAREA